MKEEMNIFAPMEKFSGPRFGKWSSMESFMDGTSKIEMNVRVALKPRCIKGKRKNRRYLMVPRSGVLGNLSKAMATKVDSEKGRRIYPQRLAVVEPVFANIEIHKCLNRFTLRSRIKVNIQWMLYCMIHNIGKILNYGVRYAFS